MQIVSEQCRAGRALLNWSQEDLEAASKVAKKTIADFERGVSIPYERTLLDIKSALEAGGVIFIPENGGGAGVRKSDAIPRLSRRKISKFDRRAVFFISYRSREFRVSLSTNILDDIDRKNYQNEREFESAFDAHLDTILLASAVAIDEGRANLDGELLLVQRDFSL